MSLPSADAVRWPALDGVRALAVALVVGVHSGYGTGKLEDGPIRGGFIGVDVFFVLSGFLITTLLVRRERPVDLSRFFERRILRIVPGVLALCVAALVVATVWQADAERANTLTGILTTITFTSDIAETQAIDANLLGHTWSVAIEAQFYVLWGAALWALLRLRVDHRLLALLAFLVAVAVAGWRWILWSHLGSAESVGSPAAERLYFGPDTRAEALFLGVALAFVVLRRGPLQTRAARTSAAVAAAVGLAVLIAIAVRVDFRSGFLYGRGGFTLVGLAACALVFQQVAAPGGPLTAVLASPALRWLGERSYSIYLWHWPIFYIVTPDRMQWDRAQTLALRLLLTLGTAAASYALVEQPFLRIKRAEPVPSEGERVGA